MEVGSSSLPGTTSTLSRYGGLAQLARAPALQAGGQRFESVILHLSGKRIDAVNPDDDTSGSDVGCVLTEIFDMLTHKTVSKDFKLID